MKSIIIILNIFLLLTGCDNRNDSNFQQNNKIIKKGINTYFTGFKKNGSINEFNIDNKNYFSIKNFETHKKIVLHNFRDTTDIIQIKLDSIVDKGVHISAFDIINKDTILILSSYENIIYAINQKGRLLKKIIIPNLVINKDGNIINFELSGTGRKFMINDTTLVCDIIPYMNTDKYESKTGFKYFDYYSKLYSYELPLFIKIDNIFSDNLVFSYGIVGFYERFMKKDEERREILHYNFINNKIFITSMYSDSIYIYNSNLEFEKAFVIESKFCDKIGVEHFSLTESEKNINYVNEIVLNIKNPKISRIKYLKDKGIYLVSLILNKSLSGKPNWSLIALDSKFKKIDEFYFDGDADYSDFVFTVSKDLVYLYNNNSNVYEKNSFQAYDIIIQ